MFVEKSSMRIEQGMTESLGSPPPMSEALGMT